MAGNLFTDYFLTDGIEATSEWRASVAAASQFDTFRDGVRQRYAALTHSQDPNEAVTEQELIRPVLELLGWTDYLPQQGASRHEDIPDLLLLLDADAKERAIARASAEERYRDAVVVEESKRFGLPLDARGRDGRRQATTPHDQIVRYLSTAEVESEGRIRWGILTNGGVWRLYDYRARPRATGYFEANLDEILGSGDTDRLRTFYLLFRRESFEAQEGATVSFLETALAEGRRYEQQVAQDLSDVVFERAFPRGGVTNNRWPRTFPTWSSSVPFRGWFRRWRSTPSRNLRNSGRRRSSSSIGCSLCSTPKTEVCFPSTTRGMRITACGNRSGTTSPAGWRAAPRSRREPRTTTIT